MSSKRQQREARRHKQDSANPLKAARKVSRWIMVILVIAMIAWLVIDVGGFARP